MDSHLLLTSPIFNFGLYLLLPAGHLLELPVFGWQTLILFSENVFYLGSKNIFTGNGILCGHTTKKDHSIVFCHCCQLDTLKKICWFSSAFMCEYPPCLWFSVVLLWIAEVSTYFYLFWILEFIELLESRLVMVNCQPLTLHMWSLSYCVLWGAQPNTLHFISVTPAFLSALLYFVLVSLGYI